jgi:Cu+-exporting ATPase
VCSFETQRLFETFEKVTTLVVGKTGTLTEGKPKLVAVEPQSGFGDAQLFRLVASLENVSEHPLAAAIVAGAREREITLAEIRDFQSDTGKGVSGNIDGDLVSIGNLPHLEALGITAASLRDRADALRRQGRTVAVYSTRAVATPYRRCSADCCGRLADFGNGLCSRV